MEKSVSFNSIIGKKDSTLLWDYRILIPEPIAQDFLNAKIKRVICTLNNTISFHCAIMPSGDGSHFLLVNKENRKKLKLSAGDDIKVKLEEDTSKYGMALPEEMEELLLMDEEGSQAFHSLTAGKQRSLLYIIGKPKSSDIRLKKAVVVLDYLKMTGGKLDFKELNEAFKQSNSR